MSIWLHCSNGVAEKTEPGSPRMQYAQCSTREIPIRYKEKNISSESNTALDQGSRKAVQPPSLEKLETGLNKTLQLAQC